ncbi:acyltransferase domain-containing protein, partial [bacterium]|nr:acyltransferase domain-containing protein [bacterium]
RILEKEGILTYFHVPAPGLLEMFIKNGVRRFVFEGRECGGHVGPRCSFVLWETMIDALLESIPTNGDASDYHVLFAGGIHDALSASMVSAMAAPLAERGVRIGAQLGTAYLFTKESVSSGAIVETFQQESIACNKTILLETALGHASRCVDTPYAGTFIQDKQRLESEGKSSEEIRDELENMNLGRLRIASKGISRNPLGNAEFGMRNSELKNKSEIPGFVSLNEDEQRASGMYMVGQVAAFRDEACTIETLHRDVSVGSSSRLETQFGTETSYNPQLLITSHQTPSDIAIIGMSCIMPKASDLQTYWENILNKVDAIIEVPKERWNWELYYDPDPRAKDKVYSKWGGFLDDIPFDPIKYGMPPNSLLSIEPLQLLTLEMVHAVLKDAGYLQRPFPRERTSVILGAGGGAADLGQKYGIRSALPTFFGNTSTEIMSNFEDVLPEWTEDSFAGILMNVASGRVANRFNLGGENYTVDAACASSLAAVHLAVKELETGNSDMVIVGGTDTMQGAFAYTCFSKTMALSPRGKCCTFDESADGIVLGEGIAMLVLKRLADAERDGDKIYAVIKSVGASSDGRDKSMTAPRPEGQALALRRAYQKANISPATVELIEAHGTGTVVGDQAEVQALCQVFNGVNSIRQRCAIGSVKSMIGHTKCTAGVASLIKAVLALHHKVLPPTLNVDKPNSKAKFENSPFYVNTETRPWVGENEHPRRAGVSAFGFGGTNFHVVLEEYTEDYLSATNSPALERSEGTVALQEWPSELFLFSGNSHQEIFESIESIEKSLSNGAKPTLRDLSYTLSKPEFGIRNSEFGIKNNSEIQGGFRLALVATSLEDFHQKLIWAQKSLASLAEKSRINDPRGIYYSEQPLAQEGKVAFLFPGQGSQYTNMLRDLTILFEEVRTSFERANQVLHQNSPLFPPLSKGGFRGDLSAYIFPPPTFSEEEEHARQKALTQTNIAQPAIGAADMAMFHLLETLGVKPDFVAGHSYGEYVALCAAGVFSEDVLIALSEARGRFIVESASPELGTMAAVEADAQIVSEVIGKIDNVGIANLNAPKQTVISGYQASVEQAVEQFNAKGVRARLIPVACAFHSPVVVAAKERLAEFLSNVELSEPKIEVFSNTTAESYPQDSKAIADQMTEHLVSPVVFITEIEALYKAGARIFVEVGPRNVLTGLTEQILSNRPALIIASDQKGRSGVLQLHHLLGRLAAEGIPIKPERLYSGRTVRQLDLKALEKETAPAELSPTTWLVNGSRAKPIKEASKPDEVISPVRLIVADDNAPGELDNSENRVLKSQEATDAFGLPKMQHESHIGTKSEAPNLGKIAESQNENAMYSSNNQNHASQIPAQTSYSPKESPSPEIVDSPEKLPHQSQVTPVSSPGGVTQVMMQFQQMMNRFLDTQKNVMMTYLQQQPGDTAIVEHPDSIGDHKP